jgi:hypothetical protein
MLSKNDLKECDRSDLLDLISELTAKVKKKNTQITGVRQKLVKAKSETMQMQSVIVQQRRRIIDLYSEQVNIKLPEIARF